MLNEHLRRRGSSTHGNKLNELTTLLYGMPKEGYRGCERRPDNELLEISDPLVEITALIELEEETDEAAHP
jgi:hypothetical protein